MDKETIKVDYEGQCRVLEAELQKVKEKETTNIIIINKQQGEIDWLKKVISSILHI